MVIGPGNYCAKLLYACSTGRRGKSIGIVLKQEAVVSGAHQSGADNATLRSDELLEAKVAEFSQGQGVDAVIITAASSSLDPVELAGVLCRTHGKVVIVGSVPTGFSRKNYYRKELDLRMSTSYCPVVTIQTMKKKDAIIPLVMCDGPKIAICLLSPNCLEINRWI